MCNNKTDGGLDVYDWVLSPEIREYLRASHIFSVREKADIVHSGCRPVEEKRAALEILLGEAENREDRELIHGLLRLYGWSLEEMRGQRPRQVYLFLERRGCARIGEMRCQNDSTGNVAGVFDTYDQLMAHLKRLEAEWECGDAPKRVDWVAYAEKWTIVDGEMDVTLGLYVYVGEGRLFIQRFEPWYLERAQWKERLKTAGVPCEAEGVFRGRSAENTLPLPFRNGDLVRVDIPDLEEPVYGVLNVAQVERERFIYLLCVEDQWFREFNMGYQEIDISSGWRVVDWTHPVAPEELPAGQGLLADLSDYLHRLEKTDKIAARELYLHLPEGVPLYHPGVKTLAELLETAQKLHSDK